MDLDFPSELDLAGTTRLVVETAAPRVTETVTITPKASPKGTAEAAAYPAQSMTHLAVAEEDWTWQQLRDYVMAQVEERHGEQLRDPRKESGIFKSFLDRWGKLAPAIAKLAFEFYDGWWRNAPITATRFCKGSDPYFAQVIADRLRG